MKKMVGIFLIVIFVLLISACSETTYTIYFEENGGSEVEDVEFSDINTVILPVSELEGYDFIGWYLDERLLHEWSISNIIAEDITLYAKWELKTFTVTYHYNIGNEISDIDASSYGSIIYSKYGEPMTLGIYENFDNNELILEEDISYLSDYRSFVNLEDDWIIRVETEETFALALTSKGKILAWGENFYGQLGDGSRIKSNTPIDITDQFNLEENENIQDIDTNSSASIVLTNQGRVFLWGYGTDEIIGYQLFNSNSFIPTDITQTIKLMPNDEVIDVSIMTDCIIMLTRYGEILALDTFNDTFYSYTTKVTNDFDLLENEKIIKMSHFGANMLLLTNQGHIYLLSDYKNDYLLISDNSILYSPIDISSNIPIQIEDIIIDIFISESNMFFVSQNGNLFMWGNKFNIPDGNFETNITNEVIDVTSHFPLMNNEKIVKAAGGKYHLIVLTDQNHIYTYGSNTYGQVGKDLYGDLSQMSSVVNPFETTDGYYAFSQILAYGDILDSTYFYPFDQRFTWYIDKACTIPYDFNQRITENVDLYTTQNIEEHTISFDVFGGSYYDDSHVTNIFSTSNLILGVPEREGSIFLGWYDNPNFLGNPIETLNLPIDTDITLYAKWEKSLYSVTVAESKTTSLISLLPGESIVKIVGMRMYTIFLTSEGRVLTTGFTQSINQVTTFLPSSSFIDLTPYFNLTFNEKITDVTVYDLYAAAITSEGRVFKWGRFFPGQDLNVRHDFTESPYPIDFSTHYKFDNDEKPIKIIYTDRVLYVITNKNQIYATSDIHVGVGLPIWTAYYYPVDVTEMYEFEESETIIELKTGSSYIYALSNKGQLYRWGSFFEEEFGFTEQTKQSTPVNITNSINLNIDETIVSIDTTFSKLLVTTSNSRIIIYESPVYSSINNPFVTPTDITSYFNLNQNETIYFADIFDQQIMVTTSDKRVLVLEIQNNDNDIAYELMDWSNQFHFDENEEIISLIYDENCFLMTNQNNIYAWGSNQSGQLGLGLDVFISEPIDFKTGIFKPVIDELEHVLIKTTFNYQDVLNLPVPEKEGYIFDGWYIDSECTIPFTLELMPSTGLILYYRWIEDVK